MSVSPHSGIIDFGTFTPPDGPTNGIQGEVPAPLSGQQDYVLTASGWVALSSLGTLIYQGTWDAATNTPTLTSGVGTSGYYYVVSVAGNTNLDGITTWTVGDWALFNGTVWQKIEGGSTVDITGGQINNTVIGNNTPAAATFTTLTATSASLQAAGANAGLTMLRNTDASSSSTRIFLDSSAGVSTIYNGGNNIRLHTGANPGTSSGSLQFQVAATASAVNYVQVTGAATTKSPIFSVAGSDTNISMALQPKGTGAIDLAAGSSGVNISNGGTVTAITRTAAGSGYTSVPSVVISAPTTAGGVQATATATASNLASGNTIASGGTGYTVNDVLTVVGGTGGPTTLTVTSVSGGVITGFSTTSNPAYTVTPTNPVSVTGGTGTGATFNLVYGISAAFTITNAGSGYVEQPTVSFSGGGGSGAAAYATVGSAPIVKSLGSSMQFYMPSGEVFRITDSSSIIGYWNASSNGTSPALRASTTANAQIHTTGTTSVLLGTNGGTTQLAVTHTASAVNYVQVTGGVTGNPGSAYVSAQGSDTNIHLELQSKATGQVRLSPAGTARITAQNANGQCDFSISSGVPAWRTTAISSQVNYLQASGAVTNYEPVLSAQGSDTNISIAFQTKGTGAIDLAAGSSGVNISNGGTVTAITRTSASTNYTSIPSLTISAPTTAGGVQATATPLMSSASATVVSGGSGYTVGDVLTLSGATGTASQYTVATLSGSAVATVTISLSGSMSAIPTNPASVTGGTGSGATFTVLYGLSATPATITNAGSGYVEQPTVTFSGGGGSGAAAYATVGSGTQIKSLGSTLDFYTPNAGIGLRVEDTGGTGTAYWRFRAGNNNSQMLATATAVISSTGSNPVSFYTNGLGNLQMSVAHTASAVNYVHVTGGATSASASALPGILFTGSDASVNAAIVSKGSGYIAFAGSASSASQAFRVVTANSASTGNLIAVQGAAAGSAPSIQAISGSSGTDTNIDLALTPKGTGVVQFGTLTATADTAISGYITIKDSGGTTRKLAVIT